MFHLIRNSELEVTLDVSGVNDHLPSVAFNIKMAWNMPFQKAKIEILECWFECASLDVFERDIKTLIDLDAGTVTLSDLSNNPVFTFSKSGADLTTCIFARDTAELGKMSFSAKGYSAELSEMVLVLGEFEKWW